MFSLVARLTLVEKTSLIRQINQGISINKISRRFNLAKSTIYYHYKKIKGKQYQEPFYNIEFSEQEGEIVGIFAGDGSQYYYKRGGGYYVNVHFGNCSNWVEHVQTLYEKFFNKKWRRWREVTKEGWIKHRIRVIDKKIFYYFFNYLSYDPTHKHDTVELKTLELPDCFKIGFLRGFLDTDGTICLSQGRVRIIYYTTSKTLANQTKILCNQFKINVSLCIRRREGYKDICTVYVLADSIDKFLKVINPFKRHRVGR